jgi:hypothetical protein
MIWNYENIKALAKESGMKITDLLALAPQNDPFYSGTETDVKRGRWFKEIWNAAGFTNSVHLRRVHYWAVSQKIPIKMHNDQPYQNTEACWDYLVMSSKQARYLGYVKIEDVIDNKNPKPTVNMNPGELAPSFQINVPNLDNPYVWVNGLSTSAVQPYHIEIWCEKSTMNDVLEPLASRYGANVVTFQGEVSISACYDLAVRIRNNGGKPCRVFYLSDFDPAGQSMPAAMSRKVEFMLQYCELLNLDVKIRPLCLTAEQVRAYDLPRIPIKESEKRGPAFEATHGTGAVELDALEALHPGALGRIVEAELLEYYSIDAAREVRQKRDALKRAVDNQIKDILSQYQPQIEELRTMIGQIKAISVDLDEYSVETYEPHVFELDDLWLFDSSRNYQHQIEFYKNHKAGI